MLIYENWFVRFSLLIQDEQPAVTAQGEKISAFLGI
jgi:hypothetical protein